MTTSANLIRQNTNNSRRQKSHTEISLLSTGKQLLSNEVEKAKSVQQATLIPVADKLEQQEI